MPICSMPIAACSVDLDELRVTLEEFIDDDLSTLITDVEGSRITSYNVCYTKLLR